MKCVDMRFESKTEQY